MNGQTVGYVRVSSVDQNTDRQTEQLKHCDKIFTDNVSGKDVERPELQKMLEHIRESDVVEVCSIDRLARNNVDLQMLVKAMNAKGVTVKFLKESLTFGHDTESNPISKMMLTMLAAISEFERELIRERQAAGIAIAKENGKYKGRKPKINKNQVEYIKQQLGLGISKSEIANTLGISRQTVYAYIKTTQNKEQ